MFNGIHASPQSRVDAIRTVRVTHDVAAKSMSRLDDRDQFIVGHLLADPGCGIRQHAAGRRRS